MDKSLLTFIAVGLGFMYLITNFLNDLNATDGISSSYTQQEQQYDQYITFDSINQTILDIKGLDISQQKDIWNHTDLKEEFLSLYPNFQEMHKFIDERIIGDNFKKELHRFIKDIEYNLISSKIDSLEAQKRLNLF